MKDGKRQWTVAQIGSRRNYIVPSTFESLCRLSGFTTDLWVSKTAKAIAEKLGVKGKIYARRNDNIPDSKVSWPKIGGILGNYKIAKKVRGEIWYKDLEQLAKLVSATSVRSMRRNETQGYWGFTLESLEAINEANKRSLPSVLEQYDPGLREDQLVSEYSKLHSGWAYGVEVRPLSYFKRVNEEWARSTKIVVSSDWSKKCLIDQGVEDEKIRIIPLAVSLPADIKLRVINNQEKIRVLFLGTFNLRKGAPDFVEIARRLVPQKHIEFLVAGPVHVPNQILKNMPKNITFLGPVPRSAVQGIYESSDILLLPAISEGFGIVQIEAGGHGLPVITTDRVGKFVKDGHNGHLIGIGDYERACAIINRLSDDREMLFSMGQNSKKEADKFSAQSYSRNLDEFLTKMD